MLEGRTRGYEATSFDRLGDRYQASRDSARSLAACQDAFSLRERLDEQDPNEPKRQRDLSVSHNKIGDVLLALGRTDQDLEAYRQSLAISEPLAKQDPSNAGWQRDLAISYQRLASTAEKAGDPGHAKRYQDLCRGVLQAMKAKGVFLDPHAAALLAELEKNGA